MNNQRQTYEPRPRCPVCGEVRQEESHAPFCSKRCRQIDLGRWLDEDYVVSRPIEQQDLDEGE